MGTQTEIVETILKQGGEYLLAVKQNIGYSGAMLLNVAPIYATQQANLAQKLTLAPTVE